MEMEETNIVSDLQGWKSAQKADCFIWGSAEFSVDDMVQWFKFLVDCFFVIDVCVHVCTWVLKCLLRLEYFVGL